MKKEQLSYSHLVNALSNTTGVTALRKKLSKLKNKKELQTLAPPIEEETVQKISRQAHYNENSKEISKWQPIVKKNRETPQLKLPFHQPDRHSVTPNTLSKNIKPTTSLEKDLDSLLVQLGLHEKDVQKSEDHLLSQISPEEKQKRLARLSQYRSLMFHFERECKRKKKIKSKKYHQIKRHLKSKGLSKDILQADADADSDTAETAKLQKELNDLTERNRIEERITQNHRNRSKWAKRILKAGLHKVDDHHKQLLMDQLDKHKELIKKQEKIDNSDTDNSENESSQSENESNSDDLNHEDKVMKNLEIVDKYKNLKDLREEDEDEKFEFPKKGLFSMEFMQKDLKKQKEEENNNEFLMDFNHPAIRSTEESQEQSDLVKRAFSLDNEITKEFKKEKKENEIEDKDKINDNDSSSNNLPGWGEWSGKGVEEIKHTTKKRKTRGGKKINKEYSTIPISTNTRSSKPSPFKHVITNSEKDRKISKYCTDSVPFPFTSPEQFENSIRFPLGPEWNTDESHNEMTRSNILTRDGVIIDPISR